MQRHPFSQPAFFLFLLVNATLIIRPAEIFVELADVRIYEFLILGALALSYKEIQQHCRLQSLRQQPMTLCVFGVFIAVILSHLSHMYLYGVRTSGIDFLKTMVYYGLWVAVVDTPRRLRITLGFIAIMSTIMVGMCVLDYYAFVDLEFITHSKDRNGFTPTGTLIWVIRMRGTGLFQDPNDISLLIVATGVICLYFLTDKSQKLWRLAWLFPLFVMGNGLLCTRSRGGLLAAAGAMIGMLLMRFGRKTAIAIGVCGMLALPLIAVRQLRRLCRIGGAQFVRPFLRGTWLLRRDFFLRQPQ